LLRRSLTSQELATAKLQKFGDTAIIISIVVRKLSVFTGFDGSWNHSNFANVMKELKIETKRGTLLDGVLFQAPSEADTVKSSGIAASRGSDTVLICIPFSIATSTRAQKKNYVAYCAVFYRFVW